MNAIRLSLLWLGVLLVPLGRAGATDPVQTPPKGKVLVLVNDHTLEGDIERVGSAYRVRRTVGETWVPADRVQCLCATWEEAYRFLRGRANLEDPDEHLRLAAWCRQNGLHEQTLAEVRAAVQLRPDHAETRRLLERLQQTTPTTPASRPSARTESGSSAPTKTPKTVPTVDVTADSLGVFVTRVQPILMNTCARCHATGRGGAFQLTRAYDVGLLNRKTVQENLAAVLAQVNPNQPQVSPLLTKAVSDHARTGQSPLRNRETPPYRTLENWVKLTLANNPHLYEQLPGRSAAPAPTVPVPEPRFPEGPAPRGESRWGEDVRPAAPTTAEPPAVSSPRTAATEPAGPPDPVDPEVFNRQMHPQQK